MRRKGFAFLSLLSLLTVFSFNAQADPVIVVSASGSNPSSIQSTVDAFRAMLGNPNNANNAGPLGSGRREINWDGGGSATSPGGTPFTVFQVTRGALITTPGTGFTQAPPSGLATTFNNATYSTIFQTFSPLRLFAVVGSNVLDVTFTVPGSPDIPALVNGFGAVFADVDLSNTTSLEFFDRNGTSLGTLFSPTADNGLSFVGGFFGSSIVSRVRITLGNSALGPNDGSDADVVAMDDFLFGEPQAVPEPMTLVLLATGLVGLGASVRMRIKS